MLHEQIKQIFQALLMMVKMLLNVDDVDDDVDNVVDGFGLSFGFAEANLFV